MILFITDNLEPWLVYIWEQFVKINKLKTGYKLSTYHEYKNKKITDSFSPVIEYSTDQKYSQSIFIPQKNKFKTDCYIWLRNDLPVFSDTMTKGGDIHHCDIFYNAFIHLSRLEEWISENSETLINSYAYKHTRKKKRIWKIPVVNLLFNELEKIIKKYRNVSFAENETPVIEFSHDVDYIEKTIQLRIKQTAFYLYNAFRFFYRHIYTESLKYLQKAIDFPISNDDYWCFDYWAELEKKYNIRSVFYVYADSGKKNIRSWLMDPSYNICSNFALASKFRSLLKEGFEVGLHGSFQSAVNGNKLRREKEILEQAIQKPVHKVRQHWLRYSEKITPHLHNDLFMFDSTVGWNDQIGFRSGCASRYNPYDHQNQKPFEYTITPLVLMDSTLFDYGEGDINHRKEKGMEILKSLNRFKKAHVSISWHQRVCSSDYRWNHLYKDILEHEYMIKR